MIKLNPPKLGASEGALQEAAREESPQFLAQIQHSGVLCGGVKPLVFIVIYSHIVMGDKGVAWISKS